MTLPVNTKDYSAESVKAMKASVTDAEKKLLKRFIEDEELAMAVRKVLVGGVLDDVNPEKRLAAGNWAVIEISQADQLGMPDKELLRRLRVKVEASKLLDSCFDKIAIIAEDKKDTKKDKEEIG